VQAPQALDFGSLIFSAFLLGTTERGGMLSWQRFHRLASCSFHDDLEGFQEEDLEGHDSFHLLRELLVLLVGTG
jgi:hypothetical protein